MEKVTLVNPTDKVVRFAISTLPGRPRTRYEVAPGETCEVAAGYCRVENNRSVMRMLAPALVLASEYTAPAAPVVEETKEEVLEIEAELPEVKRRKRGRRKQSD